MGASVPSLSVFQEHYSIPTATNSRFASAIFWPVNNQDTAASLPARIYPNDSSADDALAHGG
jgi:hypothetical protein